MTTAERRRKAARLAARIVLDIAMLLPRGVWRWPAVWVLTAPANVAYIEALEAWQAAPTSARLARIHDTYSAVLSAWLRAADGFQLHHQPTTE